MSLVTLNEQDNHVVLTMDDGKANAISFDMADALSAGLAEAEATGKIIVMAGRPGKFCAGFDLSVMGKQDLESTRLLKRGAEISVQMLRSKSPIVLAVTGHAMAMGALYLLSADYRVGTAGAFKLGLNEVAIGMTMPWFGVELVRDRLEEKRAHEALVLAQVYDPMGAREVGYLDEVVEPDDLLDRAVAVAEGLTRLDGPSYAGTKSRLRGDLLARIEAGMAKDFAALA